MESPSRPRKSAVPAILGLLLIAALAIGGSVYYVTYGSRQAQLHRDEVLRQRDAVRAEELANKKAATPTTSPAAMMPGAATRPVGP